MSLFKKRTAATQPKREDSGERRQVTVMFYDIVGSTHLVKGSDPEAARQALAQIHEIARQVITDHGGSLEQVMGDGGMAYFGYPIASEDAALQAVTAGLALLATRGETPQAPDLRIGIATSVVVLSDTPDALASGRLGAVGVAPNLAARLEASAEINTVLVGAATHALTHRAVDYVRRDGLALKGFPDVTRAWQAQALRPVDNRLERDRTTAQTFTGRQSELDTLTQAWAATANGQGRAYLIEGDPGLGKSRITQELRHRARAKRCLVLQCQPRTEGDALFAIIQMYDRAYDAQSDALLCDVAMTTAQALADLEEDETLTAEARRNAILDAVIAGFLTLANDHPLLILAEDMHWADEVTLAVIEALAAQCCHRPIVILATTRPDPRIDILRDVLKPLPLSPLPHDTVMQLIDQSSQVDLSASTHDWIVRQSDGNPLFALELTAHANDVLTAGQSEDTLSGAEVGSLRDLLTTRLDAAGQAKRTAQLGSILGREYPYHLLAKLAKSLPQEALRADLQRLTDQNLKEPIDNGYAYAFRHALVRDVAYDSQLQSVRRNLHGQVIDLLDADPTLAEDIPDSVLAEHCLAAGRTARGAALLVSVAEDALRRSALQAPRAMLRRALDLAKGLEAGADRDLLMLRAISLLGPVVTLLESPRAAAPLYESGQALYFGLTVQQRADFFPVLWGWWFTAGDLIEQARRSEVLIRDVAPTAPAESRLQALHCGWASLFDGGNHDRCLAAIQDGLALYDPEVAQRSRYLYGHDAKVCGLGERALSGWFTGQLDTSAKAIRTCEDWADSTGHLASRLHGLDIAMQVAVFQHDLAEIDRILSKIGALSGADAAPAIAAKRQIFQGWMAVRGGDLSVMDQVSQGLQTLHSLGVLEDTPFYADIAAQVTAAGGNTDAALGRLREDIKDAKATGLTFWLPELLRRQALLMDSAKSTEILDEGFAIAQTQNAQMLALRNIATRLDLGLDLPPEVAQQMASRIDGVSDCPLRHRVARALGQ